MSGMKSCQKCGVFLKEEVFRKVRLFTTRRKPNPVVKVGRVMAWCPTCRAEASLQAKKAANERRSGVKSKPKAEPSGLVKPEVDCQGYSRRKKALKKLGFKTYQEYLDSPFYKQVRTAAFGIKGTDCILCSKPANVIHHNRYKRADLVGETFDHLHPICNACHYLIEFDDNDRKRNLKDVQVEFNRLLQSRGKRRM